MAMTVTINDSTNNTAGRITKPTDIIVQSAGVKSLSNDDFKVTASGSGRILNIEAGDALVENGNWVKGSNQSQFYPVTSDSVEQIELSANSSGNPRIDVLYIDVNSAVAGGVEGADAVDIEVIEGTPAGSPVAPTPSVDNYLIVAEVLVADSVVTIVDGNITDRRVEAAIKVAYDSIFSQHLATLQGFGMLNGQIQVSVASGSLTIAVKTLSGNDPSIDDPVKILIGGQIRAIVTALSLTISAGTNSFRAGSTGAATHAQDYFVHLGWRAASSTVFIGSARLGGGRTYGYYSGTATAATYMATSGSAPASTDEVTVVGKYTATLSAGAGFNWSISGTGNVFNRPIYQSEWRTYIPQMSVSGGTAPTYSSQLGLWQVSGTTQILQIFFGNSSGGTAGSGGNHIAYTLPLTNRSPQQGSRGPAGWFNSASGEVTQTNSLAAEEFSILRASTARLVGNDQNSATRQVYAMVTTEV